MKRYMDSALLYAILAMAGGVFYREFTKFSGFTAKTTLSVVHTHYFLLGMVFFLLLLVLEKSLSFTGAKTGRVLLTYHIGLNLTAVMLVVRGVTQVMGPSSPGARTPPSPGWPGSGTSCWASAWCFCCCRSGAACWLLSLELHNKMRDRPHSRSRILCLFWRTRSHMNVGRLMALKIPEYFLKFVTSVTISDCLSWSNIS